MKGTIMKHRVLSVTVIFCLNLAAMEKELTAEQENLVKEVADLYQQAPEQQKSEAELSDLEKLPAEIICNIAKYLCQAKGHTKQAQFYKAIENIRNFMMASTTCYELIQSETVTDLLIKELAKRYTDNNTFKTAVALGTIGASQWIRNYISAKNYGAVATALLDTAIRKKQWDRAKFLLHSIPFDIIDRQMANSPLAIAAMINDVPMADLLITNGVDVNRSVKEGTALLYAIDNGNHIIVEKLIAAGADVNKVNGGGGSPLIIAAWRGNVFLCQMLLKAHANINVVDHFGSNAVLYAIERNYPELVKKLINAGADFKQITHLKQNALMIATQNFNSQLVEELLKLDLDINAVDYQNWSALHMAINNNKTEIALLLIKAKANLNQQTVTGDTPLHLAVGQRNIKIIKALLEAGADTTLKKTITEETPLAFLLHRIRSPYYDNQISAIDKEIVDLLQKYGAKE